MTAPEPHPYPVVCGARETRADGTHECIQPPQHPDKPHVWVRLVSYAGRERPA